MSTVKIFTVALFLMAAGVAQAKVNSQISNAGGYGTAGCGLGALVFGDQSGPMQIIAATLNGTGGQTFAMSSGTSNCGPSVFSSAEAKHFIDNNAVALENDVVRGQGEALSTLSKLVNCNESILAPSLKSNYKEIYSDEAQSNGKVLEVASGSCSAKI